MAVFTLPLDNDVPSYDFNTDLDGGRFRFVFRYNSRIDRWVFDVYDSDENPVQQGVPLTSDSRLLRQNVNSNKYLGTLACINTEGTGLDATRFNIGVDVKMLYSEGLNG